jgi:hypothetical protein
MTEKFFARIKQASHKFSVFERHAEQPDRVGFVDHLLIFRGAVTPSACFERAGQVRPCDAYL